MLFLNKRGLATVITFNCHTLTFKKTENKPI